MAEQDCSTALLLDPSNIKALYRRGLARKELSKFSEAARDLSDLLKQDQGNLVATKELESVKTLWRKVRISVNAAHMTPDNPWWSFHLVEPKPVAAEGFAV